MRRSQPAKRAYQVMIALDDSRSMQGAAGQLALEAVTTLCTALTRLEVGEVGVLSFGSELKLAHSLGDAFSDEAGGRMLENFSFSQEETRFADCVSTITSIFASTRHHQSVSAGVNVTCTQLAFIISDGKLCENREKCRRMCRLAQEQNVLLVAIIVDDPAASIYDLKSVSFEGGVVKSAEYLADYPFDFYAVLTHPQQLPDILSSSLRQWFLLLQDA